ncbi:MAG: hypothetical protein ACI9GZ_003472 [Bacteroidia bacterium]|jgi:hypothetical protein
MKEVVSIADFRRYPINGSTLMESTVCHDSLARHFRETFQVLRLTITFE